MFGMEMMLRQLGLDPDQMKGFIEQLMNGVKELRSEISLLRKDVQELKDILSQATIEEADDTASLKGTEIEWQKP